MFTGRNSVVEVYVYFAMQLFVKICHPDGNCPEWTMIELQGDLETKSETTSLSGKFIGDLFFTHKNQPVLIIGHHILHGKLISLEKPLAVLTKNPNSRNAHEDIHMDVDSDQNSNETRDVHYFVSAVIKQKMIFKTRPKPIIANVPKKL